MDYVVLIPSCDRYDMLRQAVRSVLAQTVPARAIWVVDDASTDPRYLVAADELADPSVHMIRRQVNSKDTCGVTYAIGAARNTGLVELLATPFQGWLAFLDDDDWWQPNKIARQLEVAAAYPDLAAIGTDATVVDPDGREVDFYGGVGGIQLGPTIWDVSHVVQYRNPLTTSTVLMPMRVVRRIGLQRAVGYGEDWEYWAAASQHGRLLRVEEDLACYRKGHRKEWSL